jgi:hypothetical protein
MGGAGVASAEGEAPAVTVRLWGVVDNTVGSDVRRILVAAIRRRPSAWSGRQPGATRVQVLHEPLDGATLAGGVAALEEDHVFAGGVLGPVLELQ